MAMPWLHCRQKQGSSAEPSRVDFRCLFFKFYTLLLPMPAVGRSVLEERCWVFWQIQFDIFGRIHGALVISAAMRIVYMGLGLEFGIQR